MNYESSILKRLIEVYGVVGNPRYISEIIKQFIVQGKECYPNLFTYQADWLAHIDEFGLTPEYTVSYTGQYIYAPNTKEKPVKRAILTGNTLVNISDAKGTYKLQPNGTINNISDLYKNSTTYTIIFNAVTNGIKEIRVQEYKNQTYLNTSKDYTIIDGLNKFTYSTSASNTFDNIKLRNFIICDTILIISDLMIIEGDHTNIDIPYFTGMQSVKMPVLTATGKNLIDERIWDTETVEEGYDCLLFDGFVNIDIDGKVGNPFIIPVNIEKGKTYTLKCKNKATTYFNIFYLINDGALSTKQALVRNNRLGSFVDTFLTFTANMDYKYLYIDTGNNGAYGYIVKDTLQIEDGSTATSYEPFKSNILSCLEPVELGSVGEVKDELNLLTQQLTQRTETRPYQEGDELNSEFVTDMTNTRYKLAQEVVKTVDLTILDQNGQSVDYLKSFNGGTHVYTTSLEGSLVPSVDISVVTNLEETLKICSLEGNTM